VHGHNISGWWLVVSKKMFGRKRSYDIEGINSVPDSELVVSGWKNIQLSKAIEMSPGYAK
jgi:hypothetical protein